MEANKAKAKAGRGEAAKRLAAKGANQIIEDEFRLSMSKMNISNLIFDETILGKGKTRKKKSSVGSPKRSFGSKRMRSIESKSSVDSKHSKISKNSSPNGYRYANDTDTELLIEANSEDEDS